MGSLRSTDSSTASSFRHTLWSEQSCCQNNKWGVSVLSIATCGTLFGPDEGIGYSVTSHINYAVMDFSDKHQAPWKQTQQWYRRVHILSLTSFLHFFDKHLSCTIEAISNLVICYPDRNRYITRWFYRYDTSRIDKAQASRVEGLEFNSWLSQTNDLKKIDTCHFLDRYSALLG